MNLDFINATAIVLNYLIKVQLECDAMNTVHSKENSEELLSFNEDVRVSNLYENISKAAHLEEIMETAFSSEFIASVVRTGSVVLIMSLGHEVYNNMIKELARAYAITSTQTIQSSKVAVVDAMTLEEIYKANSWLVFCLISSYTDFLSTEIEPMVTE